MATATKRRREPRILTDQDLVDALPREPEFFCRQLLGVHLWSKQIAILESIRDNRRTAVRSGHGPGKTFSAAAAALWFLYAHPGSRVVTTATKFSQVRDLLWHEINLIHASAPAALGGRCLQTRLDLAAGGGYAVGLSSRPGNEESFAGHHAEHILLIFDEASGIRQAVWEVAEGYMTTEGARWLAIGNPTQTSGEFYNAFHSKRDEWNTLHISALDSPAITGEDFPAEHVGKLVGPRWVEERRKWQGTPLWDIRVAGEFSKQAIDSVIALGDVEAAVDREVAPHPEGERVVAVDVARYGTDETVIATREDRRVRIAEVYVGKATTETAGRAARVADELEASRIVVDDVGVGGGVTDILQERGYDVVPFGAGERALEPDEYHDARSELWFSLAEHWLEQLDLPEDEALTADLVTPKWKVDSQGRRRVQSKDDMKKDLGRSPDRGDAVAMLFAPRTDLPEVW